MPISKLTAFISSVPARTSRRGALIGLAGGVLAAHPSLREIEEAEARKHGKRRKKKRKHKKRNDKAKVRLDATCPGAGESGFRHRADEMRAAQTFAALQSGPLVKVTLPITAEDDLAGDFVLRLSPVDSSGLPTSEELAATSAEGDVELDVVVELEFAFDEPFSVEAGVAYALVLSRPAGGDFIWRGDEGLDCVGRASASVDAESPFQSFADEFDLNFTTFVRF